VRANRHMLKSVKAIEAKTLFAEWHHINSVAM